MFFFRALTSYPLVIERSLYLADWRETTQLR